MVPSIAVLGRLMVFRVGVVFSPGGSFSDFLLFRHYPASVCTYGVSFFGLDRNLPIWAFFFEWESTTPPFSVPFVPEAPLSLSFFRFPGLLFKPLLSPLESTFSPLNRPPVPNLFSEPPRSPATSFFSSTTCDVTTICVSF